MARPVVLLLFGVLLLHTSAPPAAGLVLYSDRTSWQNAVVSWHPVDESQISLDKGNSMLTLPGGGTLSFGNDFGPLCETAPEACVTKLWGLEVENGSNFYPWAGTSTPRILWANWGDGYVRGTFSYPVGAFGLEARPNALGRSLTLNLDGSSEPPRLATSEALFFGWTHGAVTSIEFYLSDQGAGLGLAIGAMVIADEAYPPQAVPEPGTLVLLASGLVLLGGLAWARRRRLSVT